MALRLVIPVNCQKRLGLPNIAASAIQSRRFWQSWQFWQLHFASFAPFAVNNFRAGIKI
jgi:hypothetical protein